MKTAIVTGANSGLGLETARALAKEGMRVIMACRDTKKAEQVRVDGAEIRPLDLGSLKSIAAFAQDIDRVDVLVNNAGLMAVPLGRTEDGFELQFGVNHLGHFALTGALLPQLLAAGARVVTVTSLQHLRGWLDFSDLNYDRRPYDRWKAYSNSKLANLVFTYELARRCRHTRLMSLAAHPGYSSTPLNAKSETNADSLLERIVLHIGDRAIAQSAAEGALPQIRAATDDSANNGAYYGPALFGIRGRATKSFASPVAKSESIGAQLWEASARLTGYKYEQLLA